MSNYTLLNIDQSSQSNAIIDTISCELKLKNIHSKDFMNSLEMLMDTHINLVIVHMDNSSDKQEILKFFEMLSSDVENEETPIVIISKLEENELFSYTLAD